MKSIRDGQKVWPYCSHCGCRLRILDNGTLFHFFPWYNRDARGCKCLYIDFIWDQDGRVLGN